MIDTAPWFQVAEALEKHLKRTPSRRKESAMEEFGAPRGLSVVTLRTYLRARDFLSKIEAGNENLVSDLRRRSVQAINALERWQQASPEDALTAAKLIAAGDISAIEAKRRAKAAWQRASLTSPKKQIIAHLRRQGAICWGKKNGIYTFKEILEGMEETGESNTTSYMKEHYQDGGFLYPNRPMGQPDLPVDLFSGDGDKDRIVAMVVVGPYSVEQYYKKTHVNWLLIAGGLTAFYKKVALILPPDAPGQLFQDWMRSNLEYRRKFDVRLVKIDEDGNFDALVVDETVTAEGIANDEKRSGDSPADFVTEESEEDIWTGFPGSEVSNS